MKRFFWLLRLASLNLLRNSKRNLITGIALASSFSGILLFTGYVVWVEKYLRANTVFVNQSGHLLISRPNGLEDQLTKPRTALLKKDEQEKIEAMLKGDADVLAVGKGLQSMMMIIKDCRSRGVIAIGRDEGIDRLSLGQPDVLKWDYELLKPEQIPVLAKFRQVSPKEAAVFPSPILQKFIDRKTSSKQAGCEESANGSLQLLGRTTTGEVAATDGRALGTQSTGLAILDERVIYMPVKDLQTFIETDSVGYYTVYVKSLLALPSVWKRLHEDVKASGLDLQIQPFFSENVGLYYIGSVGFLGTIAAFFVLLVSSVVGLSLFSLFSMSVTERSMEIGLLAALGFPAKIVIWLFEIEAVLLCLLSLGTGLLVAIGLGDLIFKQNIRFSPPGIAGDTHFTIAWEPWVMVVIGLTFLLVSYVSIRIVTVLKLKRSALSLLQDAGTL
ncbi:MAG: hypothetical protein H7249_12855 [Chitinophagaceae bacterium]|nr:hypothetical protein [Oligoflexus sp.]